MNRRSFLTRLGVAAAGAAAIALDPEQLLWIPGKKTIIDFGSTKQILPATDAEVLQQAKVVLTSTPLGREAFAFQRRYDDLDGPRDVRLDLSSDGSDPVSFHYQGDKLISLHTAEELALLDRPFFRGKRA